ncbi:MAG: GNAT family N-acetyltransferase [Candidatus Babeliales bacterium]
MSFIKKIVARSRSLPRKVQRILLFAFLSTVIGIGYFIGTNAWESIEWHIPITQLPEEIKGKVVTLRRLKEDYFLDFHNMFSADVRKNLEFPESITLDYSIRMLNIDMERERAGNMINYLIFDNKDNKLIGHIAIRDPNPKDWGQFSFWLNEKYRGGGRAQEATKLIAKAYFRLKGEKSFCAHVKLWNQRSYKACKKAGFEDAGFFYENGKPTRYILEMHRP